MIELPIYLLILSMLALPVIVALYLQLKINTLKLKSEGFEQKMELLQTELNQEKALYQSLLEEKNQIRDTWVKDKSALDHLREQFDAYQKDLQRQSDHFRNLANEILDEKAKRFDEQQRKGIGDILNPLKERIAHFEKKVTQTDQDAIRRHASLKEQITLLSNQSQAVAQDAQNLAKALKGDFKKQGNWGEMILESILQKSGLVKDREYFTQVTEFNEEGRAVRPDVVIHLPDNKRLIIDSKVSLVSYNTAIASVEESALQSAKRAHAVAVKKHVDDLSQKNYHDLYKMESPDFVLMFIPIDTAFSLALEESPGLYAYAFERNIVIVTPSTLLATLKTVDTMWQNDRYNKNALEIASEAGKMLDKFEALTQDLEKLGKQLNTAQGTYHDTMKKLHTGRGNLVSKAQKVLELGAKASRRAEIEKRGTD